MREAIYVGTGALILAIVIFSLAAAQPAQLITAIVILIAIATVLAILTPSNERL